MKAARLPVCVHRIANATLVVAAVALVVVSVAFLLLRHQNVANATGKLGLGKEHSGPSSDIEIHPPFGFRWGDSESRVEQVISRSSAHIISREGAKDGQEIWIVEGLLHPGLRRTLFAFRENRLSGVELQYRYDGWTGEWYEKRVKEIQKYFDAKFHTGQELNLRVSDQQTGAIQVRSGYQWNFKKTSVAVYCRALSSPRPETLSAREIILRYATNNPKFETDDLIAVAPNPWTDAIISLLLGQKSRPSVPTLQSRPESDGIPSSSWFGITDATLTLTDTVKPGSPFEEIRQLRLAIKRRNESLDSTKVKIQAFFYETLDEKELVLSNADVLYAWRTARLGRNPKTPWGTYGSVEDWQSANPETLTIDYLRASQPNLDAHARKYFGYLVAVYYDDELQAVRAEPAKLLNLFPPRIISSQFEDARIAAARGEWGDDEVAAELYRKAADKGNVGAQVCLGDLYSEGRGVARDYSTAAEFYEKAAARGDALAEVNLGWLYHEGKGVPKDYDKAVELYRKSADQGNAVGQAYLASQYAEGKGVPKDYGMAVELFHRALDPRLFNDQGQPPNVFNDFAWFRATCQDRAQRNGKEAVLYATAACHLTEWKTRNFIGTLAAAYAEVGDFAQAVRCQRQAMAVKNDYPDDQEMERCLKLYEKREPYRDGPEANASPATVSGSHAPTAARAPVDSSAESSPPPTQEIGAAIAHPGADSWGEYATNLSRHTQRNYSLTAESPFGEAVAVPARDATATPDGEASGVPTKLPNEANEFHEKAAAWGATANGKTIEGQVFIVTAAGPAIKLALVQVAAIPRTEVEKHVSEVELRIAPERAKADAEVNEATQVAQQAKRAVAGGFGEWMRRVARERPNENSPEIPRAESQKFHAAQQRAAKAARRLDDAITRQKLLHSAVPYFEALPQPAATAKTDADGRFQLNVPDEGDCIIVATSTRTVVNEVERYFWMVRLTAQDSKVTLSNDNLTTSGSPDSVLTTKN